MCAYLGRFLIFRFSTFPLCQTLTTELRWGIVDYVNHDDAVDDDDDLYFSITADQAKTFSQNVAGWKFFWIKIRWKAIDGGLFSWQSLFCVSWSSYFGSVHFKGNYDQWKQFKEDRTRRRLSPNLAPPIFINIYSLKCPMVFRWLDWGESIKLYQKVTNIKYCKVYQQVEHWKRIKCIFTEGDFKLSFLQ